jgi:hypothetical protein
MRDSKKVRQTISLKRVVLFPLKVAWGIVGWAWGTVLDLVYWVEDLIMDLITG